jgi:hypothetical protein
MKITACPIERRYKPNIKARPSLAFSPHSVAPAWSR